MKQIFFIFLFISSTLCSAQNVENYFITKKEYLGGTVYNYLLADKVYLRTCSNTSCKKMNKLPIGTQMELLERSSNLDSINGLKSHWYKVKANKQIGWIWGGFIAQNAFGTNDPNNTVKFVMGFEKYVKEDDYFQRYYQIRAFVDNIEIDKVSIKLNKAYFPEITHLGSKGFKGIVDILSINVPSGESCGTTYGEIIIFWNGKSFDQPHYLIGMADADYSTSHKFIYPSDMQGEKGFIIKETDTYVEDDHPLKPNEPITRQTTLKYYVFKNGKVVPSSRKGKVTKYKPNY